MLTWRFLLLAYNLNANEEFGRLPEASSEQEAVSYLLKQASARKSGMKGDAKGLE